MEDALNAREFVRAVAGEEEVATDIQMFTQQLHDRVNNYFDDTGLFDQLSSLKRRWRERRDMTIPGLENDMHRHPDYSQHIPVWAR